MIGEENLLDSRLFDTEKDFFVDFFVVVNVVLLPKLGDKTERKCGKLVCQRRVAQTDPVLRS